MTYTVQTKFGLKTFDSNMTNAEAMEKLKELGEKAGNFGQDLVRKGIRGLSSSQWTWVHKLVIDATTPPAPKPDGVDVSLSKVIELFDHASQHIKYPKISFQFDFGQVVLQRTGSGSKVPGAVNVTDGGSFGNNKWYGRIERDGTYTVGRSIVPVIRSVLIQLAMDPAGFAAKCGKESGHCIFCCQTLTTEESVSVGYGPVCAKHYNLPWGSK